MLGGTGHLQPDWFKESMDGLQPLFVARNVAYSRWLGTGSVDDLSARRGIIRENILLLGVSQVVSYYKQLWGYTVVVKC